MENIKKEGSAYIGDYLGKDLAAFCGGIWYEGIQPGNKDLKIMDKLWSIQNGYFTFCWPGAILPAEWLAYRGMIGWAAIVDVIMFVCFIVANYLSKLCADAIEIDGNWPRIIVMAAFYLLYAFGMGICTIRLYRKNVMKKLDKRGLKNRKDLTCPELEESLKHEGKTSILRAIVYRVMALLIGACIMGISLTCIYLFK